MSDMVVKRIKTSRRKEALNITELIEESVKDVKSGIAVIYVPHTTAGIVVNEAYDSDVTDDILNKLAELIPYSDRYRHIEGNSDAHIQSSIIGSSVCLIIENHKPVLGRWQGVFFMEFDGPRNREIYIKVVEG